MRLNAVKRRRQQGSTSPVGRRTRGAQAGPVVIVHSSDEMYGADRILIEVALALRDEVGLEVEVWLPATTGDRLLSAELERRGFPVAHLPLPILRRANLSLPGLVELVRAGCSTLVALRRRRPAAIYLMTSACLPVAPLGRLAGTAQVLVHLQERWSGAEARVLRVLARFCRGAIAISSSVAQASQLKHPPVEVVANGVSLPADTTESVAASSPRPRYLVASRWNSWKGHGTLVRAWEAAGCPGSLVVLGAAPDNGRGVDVPALIREVVSRPESIDVVGQVESIGPYLDWADAMILPSDQPEPFGLVIIEAFGRGRPVIASRGGGPAEIITDGVDGWLYELGSVAALAELLGNLEPDALERAGDRARQSYLEHYTPENYRNRIAEVVRRQWNVRAS